MSLTDEERAELDRLEATFEENGGRGVEGADQIDFLRAKAEHLTVTELIEELRQTADPDRTFVVIDDSEVDYPMEFISLAETLGRR